MEMEIFIYLFNILYETLHSSTQPGYLLTAMWSAWEETGRIGSRKLCIEILRFNRSGLVWTISTSYSDIDDKSSGEEEKVCVCSVLGVSPV